MRIVLLSDTHGYMDEQILKHVGEADEVWHAGDFGTMEVSDKLTTLKPLRGVYGNIDGEKLRLQHPSENRFTCEGFRVWMIHIGGYPPTYNPQVRDRIRQQPPDIFITGHSHILKIMRDPALNNLLHLNPGAAGKEGFHKVRTLMKFRLKNKVIDDMQVVELGKR